MSSDDDESVDQGSGWGWGWLSEAAKVAKTAYESNVKPALQSMEQATSEFVQDMTKAIDVPEEEVEPASETDIDRAKSPGSSYPTDEVPEEDPVVEEQRNESILSDAMGGIAYLGEMVKKIGSQIGDVDDIEATFKRGKEQLVTAVGEAYSFITEDEETQRVPSGSSPSSSSASRSSAAPHTPSKGTSQSAVPNTPSHFPSTPSSAPASSNTSVPVSTSPAPSVAASSSRPSLASPTFTSLFEAKHGNVDLAALENLSMQSSIQLQQIVRKLTESQRANVTEQQEQLRAIFAQDSLTDGAASLDLATLALPAAVTEQEVGSEAHQAREKFATHIAALHQKLSFYASRTSSLQGFALKALSDLEVPEDGDVKALSEGTLNYRGKMQLEALRQLAEFTALSIHQLLLLAEHVQQERASNPDMDLTSYAEMMHSIALTTRAHASTISNQIISAMRALGNSFKEKANGTAVKHPETATLGPSTLKRISAGISNVQLDLATAMSSIIDASRFTLALFQHLQAQSVNSE